MHKNNGSDCDTNKSEIYFVFYQNLHTGPACLVNIACMLSFILVLPGVDCASTPFRISPALSPAFTT